MARIDVYQKHVAHCEAGEPQEHGDGGDIDLDEQGTHDDGQYWDWGPSTAHDKSVETPDAASWAGLGGDPAFEVEVAAMTVAEKVRLLISNLLINLSM